MAASLALLQDDEPQLPLVQLVEHDDIYLAEQSKLLWFDVLRNFNYKDFQQLAAQYYEGLWMFNQQAKRTFQNNQAHSEQTGSTERETKMQATLRLVFARPTVNKQAKPLADVAPKDIVPIHVNPETLKPGSVPIRFFGKQPKCFFAMFKSFVAMAIRGKAPEPEIVSEELNSNPAFARACGFSLPTSGGQYRQSDIPSLRKLQQFDQIMADNGLWATAAISEVARNLNNGTIEPEKTLVHDTVHYEAWSSMTTVPIPTEDPANPIRKSHPRTTKNCRCDDWTTCQHPWVSADEGAGTVAKGR